MRKRLAFLVLGTLFLSRAGFPDATPPRGQFDLKSLAGTYDLTRCTKDGHVTPASYSGLELSVHGDQVEVRYIGCSNDPLCEADWDALVQKVNEPKSQREEWGDGHKDVYAYEAFTTRDGVYWLSSREAFAGGVLKDAWIYSRDLVALENRELTVTQAIDRKFPVGASRVQSKTACTFQKN